MSAIPVPLESHIPCKLHLGERLAKFVYYKQFIIEVVSYTIVEEAQNICTLALSLSFFFRKIFPQCTFFDNYSVKPDIHSIDFRAGQSGLYAL